MSATRSAKAKLVGAATGVLAVGIGLGVAVERYLTGRREDDTDPELDEPFGDRRGRPVTVRTNDGVDLYAEIEELPGAEGTAALTVIFCHGYALNLDCWYFQRRAFAGQARMVFYDQRSHGRSARAPKESCTIDQLGDDLARVIEETAPEGPLVLIGHSMGGMSVLAYAARHQEEFAERVLGVALLATSAGDMREVTLGAPGVFGKIVNRAVPTIVSALSRVPRLVDHGRRTDLNHAITRRYSFASKVPRARVEFVAEMLASTPIDVVGDFLPMFSVHDKYEALDQLAEVDVVIMCGEDDLITPVEHSRQIARRLPAADYVELPECGHMLCIEYPDVVNKSLRELIDRAANAAAWEASR